MLLQNTVSTIMLQTLSRLQYVRFYLFVQSKEERYFINNHLSFRVMYHKDPETDSARIVGFEVTPNRYCRNSLVSVCSKITMLLLFYPSSHSTSVSSINHEYKEWDEKNPQLITCNKDTKNLPPGSAVPQEVDAEKEIVFTYDVSFKVRSN